ncbi:MAG: hypothetical protein HC817_13080 [Saprospiraceae bacterium]|nr:hypothetical protein [Saprospiraceae bacterium]
MKSLIQLFSRPLSIVVVFGLIAFSSCRGVVDFDQIGNPRGGGNSGGNNSVDTSRTILAIAASNPNFATLAAAVVKDGFDRCA